MTMVEKALAIAYQAHTGQLDKGGNPYVLHPITIALYMDTDEEKAVALLHDVVEDTEISICHLAEAGLSDCVCTAVDAITKREGEDYQSYLERVKQNPIALKVKLADMEHNSDTSRLIEIREQDLQRLEKYQNSIAFLKASGI